MDIGDMWGNTTASGGEFPSANATTTAVKATAGAVNEEKIFRLALQFYTQSVLGTLICIIGFTGSTISFIVLAKDKKHHAIATFLLQSLCISDNCFLIFEFLNVNLVFAFWYWDIENPMHKSWFYMYTITRPLLYVTNFVNLWLTVLIAGMRYIAVCRPLQASRILTLSNIKISVAVVIVFGFIFHASCFFENAVEDPPPHYWISERHFTQQWSYKLVHNIILYAIFYFCIPLILLIFFMVRLIATYRRGSIARRSRQMGASAEDQVTLVMILIVSIFVICQTPYRCIHWTHYVKAEILRNRTGLVIGEIARLMVVVNCSVNFFIYCTCRRKFRHSLQKMCCRGAAASALLSSFRTSSRRTTDTVIQMKQINGS